MIISGDKCKIEIMIIMINFHGLWTIITPKSFDEWRTFCRYPDSPPLGGSSRYTCVDQLLSLANIISYVCCEHCTCIIRLPHDHNEYNNIIIVRVGLLPSVVVIKAKYSNIQRIFILDSGFA